MKKNNSRISLVPAFNVDRQLKSDLANSMWGDSNDLLWRAKMSLSNPPSYSKAFLAKVFVDILMSVESTLKSLIISLSKKQETPEEAYLVARNCGHKILNLYQMVESRSYRRLKLLSNKDFKILSKANALKVENRYKLITTLMLIQEDWQERELGTGEVSSILNFDFMDEFLRVTFKLHEISLHALKKFCDNRGVTGSNMVKLRARQTTFYRTLRDSRRL